MRCPFEGSLVALPTPFADGEVDLETFGNLIDRQMESDSDGLVVAGSTGEAPTLTDYERRSLIHAAVERCAGRLPVLAGVGTPSTSTAIELCRFAAAAGADGLLVVTPYYNRPSRRGLVQHFLAVADATEVPVVLYNVPGRTGVDLLPDAVAEIHERCENVVAIKESSGTPERALDLQRACEIAVLAGEDGLIAAFMARGAVGAINVIGNVLPDETAELIRVARPGAAGDTKRTGELVERLTPLMRDLALESNPVPLKAALADLQLCSSEVRPPLAPLEERNLEQLEATLAEAGLI